MMLQQTHRMILAHGRRKAVGQAVASVVRQNSSSVQNLRNPRGMRRLLHNEDSGPVFWTSSIVSWGTTRTPVGPHSHSRALTRPMSTDSSTDSNPSLRSLWDPLPTFRVGESSSSKNRSTQTRQIGTNPTPGGFAAPKPTPPRPRSRSVTPRGMRRSRLPHRNRMQSVGNLFPLSAIHCAQTIDLFPLLTVFHNSVRKELFGKNSIVIQLGSANPEDPPRYVAVFRFGSVVFLNVSPRDVAAMVREIKLHAKEPVPAGFERKESFGILVKPNLLQQDEEITVTGDYCVVPDIDMNGVAVISNIMGQTVALDTYNDTVDELLANFASLNASVAKTGKFSSTDKGFLFKTVAQNNSIFIDMISKIRIKDRSETAWKITKYETIHYGLKSEFELDERFDQIEYKLSLIQGNSKFFLDVMQSEKSNSLEWIIVILISVECVIMCVEMSGYGRAICAPIAQLFGG